MINILKVSRVNCYIKSIMDGDEHLSQIFIAGEISNFTNHYKSGHIYLSLKDDKSVIKAVIFNNTAQRLKFNLQDGMNVIARGRVSVYEASGQYQLYIDDIQPDGIGAVAIAFEQLKEKLSKEGLFDKKHKKAIPSMPQIIGIITSPTGAAIKDIENILGRRFPLTNAILYPSLVQGENSVESLIKGIEFFNECNNVDVIIIGRGGGSFEDLFPFNDEKLARAIFASSIPIISAVGHETDYTICDFVADLRAETPSSAAELAVPNKNDIIKNLNILKEKIFSLAINKITDYKQNLDRLANNKILVNPYIYIDDCNIKLDNLSEKLKKSYEYVIKDKEKELFVIKSMLNNLSPNNILKRGYAIVCNNGKTVTSVKDISIDDKIIIKLNDGEIECKVSYKENKYE